MLRWGSGAVGAPAIKRGLETLAISIVGINYAVENNEIIKKTELQKAI